MKYLIFYKPYDVLSSFTDDEGGQHTTLKEFIPVPDVYAAGRLDRDSEGLLFLTDDGELSHRLTHPHYQHTKTYMVQVEGAITPDAVAQLRRGVPVKGVKTQRAEVDVVAEPNLPPRSKPVRAYHPTTWLRIGLREGKKRQIRHMTAAVGYPTLRLVRVAIGALTLGDLQPGHWRELTATEVTQLKQTDQTRRATHNVGNRSGLVNRTRKSRT